MSREPITHPLATSASRLTAIFLWFTAVIIGAGLLLDFLKTKGAVSRSDLTFFLILASLPFCGVLFNLVRSWRVWPEFRAMRRGDYLARWSYTPEQARALEHEIAVDHTWRVKLLFWGPFWVIVGAMFVLSVIGAFAKSNPMLVVKFTLHALWIGALVGAVLAAPAYFLLGVSQRIARQLDPVVIFTRTGVYTPGRFVPVMDFGRGRRKVTLNAGREGEPAYLDFELVQGVYTIPGRPGATTTVGFSFPVPPECLEEARTLAARYQS